MPAIERVYKKITGVHPRRDLEPPLTGQALITALKRIRKNVAPRMIQPIYIEEVQVYECGTGGDGPFTVLFAKLSDKTTVGCYVFQSPPEPHCLMEFAQTIPTDEWFTLNSDQPSASGL